MAYSPPITLSPKGFRPPMQERQMRNKLMSNNTNVPRPKAIVNSENEKNQNGKCPVYIHQISSRRSNNGVENGWKTGNEMHQHLYKHEYSEFYDSLNLKNTRIKSCPSRIPKVANTQQTRHLMSDKFEFYPGSKIPLSRLNQISKINKSFIFRPENKLVADKLEESYWAKWKPSKVPITKDTHKMKGLYTENEKEMPPLVTNTNEKKERGDSNEQLNVPIPLKLEPSHETIPPSPYHSSSSTKDNELGNPFMEEVLIAVNSKELNDKEIKGSTEDNVPSEINADYVAPLKHTDSFILNSKKQSEEKPRYQQPKCIKLFKNVGYETNAPTNYIKGGTYPLKSCLKNQQLNKTSTLGRPGGPVVVYRKPGKANRFTTSL